LSPIENGDLFVKSSSHRKVRIEFTKGGGNPRDPIKVVAIEEVSVHARWIARDGEASMNLQRLFCGEVTARFKRRTRPSAGYPR
jgi:hypothetical protein